MRIRKTFDSALTRLTGERASSPPSDDPAFRALCLNLSHILHLPATSPRVLQAATVSWRNRTRACDLALSALWPTEMVQQLQSKRPLLVIPPAGCLFCPSCLGDGITGYLLSPDPTAAARHLCGSPANIWLAPIEAAYAAHRAIWFGWFAAPPGGRNGVLVDIVGPHNPHSREEAISEILRRTEVALRALPGQCLADKPFWLAPFQPT